MSVMSGLILVNLLCLLMGFALLSQHFEKSQLPLALPKFLPHDWKGGFVLLVMIWVLSSFLDNIAAALIGGAMAHQLFRGKVAVSAAIVVSIGMRRPDWEVLPRALRSSIFLLSLVLIASMMPVERLPNPSPRTTLGLGFVSAVFDNIPLTALALKQGGYDWGPLAYAVGFGGSMIWFGSSAGVAISSIFPEAKSVTAWVKAGWVVAVAYVAGFAVMLALIGWHAEPKQPPKHGRPEMAVEHVSCIVRNEAAWQPR